MQTFPKPLVQQFGAIKTPFYYYDLALLESTLDSALRESEKYGYVLHYAVKANTNDKILCIINKRGLGADCVSGNEIKKVLEVGFNKDKLVFAGVGKTDEEITYAIEKEIFCFNCESVQELEVINDIAGGLNVKVDVALRINPNVVANTHQYITTGKEENKFGIRLAEIPCVIDKTKKLSNIRISGIHTHIGSQILDLDNFKDLCTRINEIQNWFSDHHIHIEHVNAGGGLGINYENPDQFAIPEFVNYFAVFNKFLHLYPGQKLHFELGRALVGQCGSLISKVLFIKEGLYTDFVVIDAGMTDLLRPALYQAYHKIENITSNLSEHKYDIVGPICETSDCFGKAIAISKTVRGDLIAIRSTGAYGETMSSNYNLRDKCGVVFSDEL